ncbi:Gypsy retrotransposon integrase-like protein 1 [Elysia marginata]|uniref:Gypsy retrotransposon integrase-like protein 1 n=1 Tax=Elysia marginata TaxID=1093978 RepID=A0AAV4GBJ6_9GAST|nr:Gypsy retrotransposon integrase-like protein 1 [Elysia marginata]
MQAEDQSLRLCFQDADTGKEKMFKFSSAKYTIKNGLLYRQYKRNCQEHDQLVIPSLLVPSVLKLAHDVPVAGHMGVARTKERILQSFYWPNVQKDVKMYCRSCKTCQMTLAKRRTPKAPVQPIPVISEPFQKVAIDLDGPIAPHIDKGNRYILTIVDSATRWPEAIPLRNITTVAVTEAVSSAFSRLGLPKQFLADRGTQFMSELMKELFSIQPINTSPYHPASNGMCERLNGTLETMLRKVAEDPPKDWDLYLPAVLFAYREMRQESTGYSPFEIVYGRLPRGPIEI